MDYIHARVRTDHLDHIEEVKESDVLIDSDDEAVRYIFDRARQADFLEREIDQLRREIDYLEEEYEDEVRKAGTRSSEYTHRLLEERNELKEQLDEISSSQGDTAQERQAKAVEKSARPHTYREAFNRATVPQRFWWWLVGVPAEGVIERLPHQRAG